MGRFRTLSAALLLACAAVLPACAGNAAPGGPAASARFDRDTAEIRGAIRQGAVAFQAGDPEGILARYARDVVLSYPGIPDQDHATLVRGYADIRNRPAGVRVTPVPTFDEVLVSGDMAIVRVRWTTTTVTADPARTSVRRLKDLQVWRREPDGRWMFVRGMHYREPDPQPAALAPGS